MSGMLRQAIVERAEIFVAIAQQLLEALDHEIGLLEIIDDIFSAHYALQIEQHSVWRGVLERE